MKVLPPQGVPPRIRWKEKTFEWDCMAGTGDPIYVRKEGKDGEERIHVINVRSDFARPSVRH